ncbi:MAG: hypothetical protein ACXW39_10135, partial [Nitrospira sp.]
QEDERGRLYYTLPKQLIEIVVNGNHPRQVSAGGLMGAEIHHRDPLGTTGIEQADTGLLEAAVFNLRAGDPGCPSTSRSWPARCCRAGREPR